MAKPKHDALIFIDTNVFLDYYRVRGDTGTLSLLKHVDTHRQQIITTGQVEMEFKKNRQRVILESLKNLKAPEWASLTAPPFLAEPRAIGILRRHRTSTEQQVRKMQTQIERVLRNPAQHDTVYAITQRLFKAESPYNLDRSKTIRRQIRSLARKRFSLGYPPRKDHDLSLGDAINCEWLIHCAIGSKCRRLIIVSRDSDYGVRHPKGPILNDWLVQEFKDRVSRKRTLILTDRLSEGLKSASIAVTAAQEKAEIKLVGEIDSAKKTVTANARLSAAEKRALLELFRNRFIQEAREHYIPPESTG
jgi:predicted nucleic acid-binding protein